MVLRIKERAEAIQLITMDPKVCGKLLTLHRRGNGVYVEALHDRIPLRQDAGKGPQMGSHGYRRLRKWKMVSWLSWMFSGYKSIYRRRNQVRGTTRVPRGWGRALPPWACPPTSWPPRCVSDFISKSSGLLSVQERSSRRFHSVWTPFSILFLQNSKIGKKTGTGPSVNRLVTKII